MAKKRKHLLVLTDAQLATAITALSMESEDYSASGESHPSADKALKILRRQRCEGLNSAEFTWAMEEAVRIGRRSK